MNRHRNKKTRTLSMPSKFADMTEEEMEYRGGSLESVCCSFLFAGITGSISVAAGYFASLQDPSMEDLESSFFFTVGVAMSVFFGVIAVGCAVNGICNIDAVQNWWARKTNPYGYIMNQMNTYFPPSQI